MSNDVSYLSALERLLSESRAAAKRRCKDNDAMIGQQCLYENKITEAKDHGTCGPSTEVAVQEKKDIS